MTRRKTSKMVRAGRFMAEVEVEPVEDSTGWSPYLSPEDARRLDAVRKALEEGRLADAARAGRVFELRPVSAA